MTYDDPRTVTFLFEECARRFSGRVALEFDGGSLSYGELNRRANRLAHHLRDSGGVGRDDRVAIVVRHPRDVVIAMLAVLKAGGAYVPLDPDNPPGVTQRIVEDVAPKAVVIESSAAAGAMYFDGELFVMDVMAAALTTPDTDPVAVSGPSDLAYVIYTSGSTGRPKGVAVEHRAIVNTLVWRNAYYGFGPGDVTLAIPRPSFDSAVADTFCALTSGACLLLPRRDRITDRHYLTGLMERGNVSHFLITPMLYKRLLEGMDGERLESLRSVTVAGEGFGPALVWEHCLRLPGVGLFNEYGPSENAVCSTVHPLAAGEERVLIGKPIANTQAFVVDEDGSPVGPGGVGELYVAGAGLARGYLGDPALTAERFVTMPDGRRVYRTGDIVRLHAGGDLEFVERRDNQVKIRGRRVELGSVAQVLSQDPAVGHAHVLQYTTDTDNPLLIAFVQGVTDADVDRLRLLAEENLPAYMVPSVIVAVESVPLTGNGKVDDRALTALYEGSSGRGAGGARPASEAEAVLLEIWRELFAPLPIGLDDDFLDLGGDSLSVMDLLARVEQRIGVQLEVSDPYTDRTIRSLALVIEDRQNDKVGAQ